MKIFSQPTIAMSTRIGIIRLSTNTSAQASAAHVVRLGTVPSLSSKYTVTQLADSQPADSQLAGSQLADSQLADDQLTDN